MSRKIANFIRSHLQISLVTLTEFKRINEPLFCLESSENSWCPYDFRGNYFTPLNWLDIRSEIGDDSVANLDSKIVSKIVSKFISKIALTSSVDAIEYSTGFSMYIH